MIHGEFGDFPNVFTLGGVLGEDGVEVVELGVIVQVDNLSTIYHERRGAVAGGCPRRVETVVTIVVGFKELPDCGFGLRHGHLQKFISGLARS